MPYFEGGFRSIVDIEREFNHVILLLPDEIIAAGYWYESYDNDGTAVVIYKDQDGRVYEVNGSHCSCYGLEGQWEPELASINELRQRYSQACLPYGVTREFADAVVAGLPPIPGEE